jgi:RNA polymerase sigma-70 factor (ECF subfamily)
VEATREEVSKSTASIEKVFRQEYARIFAHLVRLLGDFDAAEDALQDAYAAALTAWTVEPENPGAWITVAARNAAISAQRKRLVAERKERDLIDLAPVREEDDDRLRLIFTCCHPALAADSSIALALRTIGGLSTDAIARLLLVPEPTVAQRLVRAKRKIRASGIPFALPADEQLEPRIDAALNVVYLMFTAGYVPTDRAVINVPLCEEAIRLGRLMTQLLPRDGETRGLLALMLLHHARHAARVDASGGLVPLEAQDRARWDRSAIAEGVRTLDEAFTRGGTGVYRIEAAIAALHTEPATDWPQIASLYQELYARAPSAPTGLGWCIALGMARSADHGLALLERLELEPGARVDAVRLYLEGRRP